MTPDLLCRRAFLLAAGSTVLGIASARRAASAPNDPPEVTVVEFSDAGLRGATVRVPKVVKTQAEWRAELPDVAYQVTRRAETERPFTGRYSDHWEPGLYRCVCCDTALFSSDTKFDSKTGWPSFWMPLAKENLKERVDFSFNMERIAIACRRCDAHLGHLFDDGPPPTRLRYCINSVALRFIKRA